MHKFSPIVLNLITAIGHCGSVTVTAKAVSHREMPDADQRDAQLAESGEQMAMAFWDRFSTRTICAMMTFLFRKDFQNRQTAGWLAFADPRLVRAVRDWLAAVEAEKAERS